MPSYSCAQDLPEAPSSQVYDITPLNEYLPANAKRFDREEEQAANEVEKLFDNPRRLEEMQMSSRSMAESLDWSRVVPRLLNLYGPVASS